MSHDQDLEAPTIFVEAPPEDEQDDLLDGVYLNSAFHSEQSAEMQALFRHVYPETTSSSRPDQFPFEQATLGGQQISPLVMPGLRDGLAGNVFLAPNDQTSPVDGSWSPVSTSEGDVFSDNWSEVSSNRSPSVHSSSPSSPSLSPLNTSFNNIMLSDDNVVQGPAFFRARSNSYTGSSDPQVDFATRPRSASFTDLSSLGDDTQLYQGFVPEANIPPHYLPPQQVPHQISQWSSAVQNETAPDPSFDPSLFGTFDMWNNPNIGNFDVPSYAPPPGPPPSQSQSGSHGRSLSTHLTVPVPLQRRDAHRRRHSHTGVEQESARGRKRFSPTGSVSSRHSSRSRDPSPASVSSSPYPYDAPYLNFGPTVQTDNTNFHEYALPSADSSQSGFLSPTSTSSNSPHSLLTHTDFFAPASPVGSSPQSLTGPSDAFLSAGPNSSRSLPITILGHDSEPEIIYSGGVARRHSFGGSRSPSASRSNSPLPSGSSSPAPPELLHRAASDPIGQGRTGRKRAPTVPRKYPGLLKPASEVDEAGPAYPDSTMMINVPIEGVHSAPAPQEFKSIVGSDKIVQASNLRRKNEPKFKCDICDHRFTAKHNLQNHMNSHTNRRPHECQKCGNTFTTRGTHARHESICAGRSVRKRS